MITVGRPRAVLGPLRRPFHVKHPRNERSHPLLEPERGEAVSNGPVINVLAACRNPERAELASQPQKDRRANQPVPIVVRIVLRSERALLPTQSDEPDLITLTLHVPRETYLFVRKRSTAGRVLSVVRPE